MRAVLSPPPSVLGIHRLDWQIECVDAAAGRVLNIGCNEDFAGLRRRFGPRVVNCDLAGWDEHENRPNAVDAIFNCLETPWPFEDDIAELVVLGDILEHFPRAEIERVLTEARRVSTHLCVTAPEDTRIDEASAVARHDHGDYNWHTTIVTGPFLEDVFARTGWRPVELFKRNWQFGTPDHQIEGWCALAERA